MIRVEHGDMREVIPRLVAEGVVVDAVVTDPPYDLNGGTYASSTAVNGKSGSLNGPLLNAIGKADNKNDRWGSRHPTVKPVELMKWLVALVTPPGGLVLDPFAGSGTAAVAALGAARSAILIEREDTYVADIRERVAFYEGSGRHSLVAKNRNRRPAPGALL